MSLSVRINTPDTACQVIDGEAVLIRFDTGQYYSSLGTGGEIIQLLEAGYSVPQIVHALTSPEAVCDDVAGAVQAFVAELVQEGLFVAANDGRTASSGASAPTTGTPFETPVLHKYTELEDLLKLDPIHDVDPAGWPLRAE